MSKPQLEKVDPNFNQEIPAPDANGLVWRSITDAAFTMRGLPWYEENKRGFCRLPQRAEKIVREPVWTLAQCPAGANVSFRTDSTSLFLRYETERVGKWLHFALTGSDGLFVYEGEPFEQRPWNMVVTPHDSTSIEKEIAKEMPRRQRTFTIYLPSYAPLRRVEIGLDAAATIAPPPPCRLAKPLLFYGTSITQGGCASTAGGDFASIIGRRLNVETINLGFSGNGKGEPELAHLIAEVDAAAFILDYCANTTAEGLDATLPQFIDILRARHPATPIVCLSKVHYYRELHNAEARTAGEAQRDTMIRHYSARRAAGDQNIHFIDGWSLVGTGEDLAFVDGVHPTSHGFALMAERLLRPLRHVLGL